MLVSRQRIAYNSPQYRPKAPLAHPINLWQEVVPWYLTQVSALSVACDYCYARGTISYQTINRKDNLMSDQNLAIVEEIYQCFAEDDISGLLECVTEDFTFDHRGNENPESPINRL